MAKQFIDCIAVYITNVCGMACEGCVSFNNYVLKGHYTWEQSEEKINRWGELIDVRQITIIGGEPFLHPKLHEWVSGVRKAFPDCNDIRVVTGLTGHQLLQRKTEILKCIENNVSVQISVHDPSWWQQSIDTAKEVLDGLVYTELTINNGGSFPLKEVQYLNDNNQLIFSMMELWSFFPNAQKEIKDGVIYLHNNDPVDAHKKCYCRTSQYLVNGDMYKCALTAVADVISTQLPLDQRSKELLLEVKGLNPLTDIIDVEFSEPIPQCSLCSINMENLIPIYPISVKKPKL